MLGMEIDSGIAPLLDSPSIHLYESNFNLGKKLKENTTLDWDYKEADKLKDLLDGMSVHFRCNSDQMQLKGPTVVKCTEHGNYSSAFPTCQKRPSKSIFESLFYSLGDMAIKFRFVLFQITFRIIWNYFTPSTLKLYF